MLCSTWLGHNQQHHPALTNKIFQVDGDFTAWSYYLKTMWSLLLLLIHSHQVMGSVPMRWRPFPSLHAHYLYSSLIFCFYDLDFSRSAEYVRSKHHNLIKNSYFNFKTVTDFFGYDPSLLYFRYQFQISYYFFLKIKFLTLVQSIKTPCWFLNHILSSVWKSGNDCVLDWVATFYSLGLWAMYKNMLFLQRPNSNWLNQPILRVIFLT